MSGLSSLVSRILNRKRTLKNDSAWEETKCRSYYNCCKEELTRLQLFPLFLSSFLLNNVGIKWNEDKRSNAHFKNDVFDIFSRHYNIQDEMFNNKNMIEIENELVSGWSSCFQYEMFRNFFVEILFLKVFVPFSFMFSF